MAAIDLTTNSTKRRAIMTAMGLALILAACSSPPPQQAWSGPKMLASITFEDAPSANPHAKIIRTAHYKIYSTVEDRPDLLNRTGQLMEGAFDAYRAMVPQVPPTDYPMQCYLFADRTQWADFTRQHTGLDSTIYLQISRGGYTVHDWYVAYFIGDIGTYSVAAHEGWHQFVNRHFRGRLPPFLEEGLACMFENVEWGGDLPRWNLSVNPARTISLRKALNAKATYPLSALVTLHAGQIVNQAPIKVEAFYAQAWAFARYLWEGENGKYRPALRRLLADTADGTVFDPTGSHRRSYLPWNPDGVRPMLEHYLGENLVVTDQGYQRFIRQIAFDDREQAEPSP
jgi:hypothetical protein